MKIDKLALKPIREYDKDGNGTIDGEEVSIFKADCKTLYAEVYGKKSKQYRECAELLDKTEVSFNDQGPAGVVSPIKNDYEKQKYFISLDSTPQGKPLKDCSLNISDIAGVLLHESEHLRQNQRVYEQYKKEFGGDAEFTKRLMTSVPSSDRFELYAEMERMYFNQKTRTYSQKDTNETYKDFVAQSKRIGVDPLKDREKFLKNFNEQEFLNFVKNKYPNFDKKYYEDKNDALNLKEFLY